MDISNVTTKNSMTTAATAVESANKSVAQGKSLPGTGNVGVRPEKLKADTAQSGSVPQQPSSAELRELVGQANEALQARFSDLKFTVDEGTDISVVRIEDSETGEVIRQFPSEAMLAIAHTLSDMKQGTVFEEKA